MADNAEKEVVSPAAAVAAVSPAPESPAPEAPAPAEPVQEAPASVAPPAPAVVVSAGIGSNASPAPQRPPGQVSPTIPAAKKTPSVAFPTKAPVVVKPVDKTTIPANPAPAPAAPKSASAVKVFHFVKNGSVADKIVFADKTTYQFRLILRNDNSGYQGQSFVKTTDAKLAENLREVAKRVPAYGIKEIPN